jgi:hypothetical protein
MRSGRRKRVWAARLAVLAAVVAAVTAVAVVIAMNGASGKAAHTPPAPDPTTPVPAFVADWHAGDYAGMYALVSPLARARVSYSRFVAFYKNAAVTATVRGLRATGRPRREGTAVTVPMSV